jgi:UDP-N-acetylmuramate dehydrogenase
VANFNLPDVRGEYAYDVPLAPLTTIKVGGLADVMFTPADLEDLQYFLKNKPIDLPVTLLGEGSNVVIRDGGIKGVVLRLNPGLCNVSVEGNIVSAEGGATCGKAARAARAESLTGLEFFGGIPGSVGGALKMNAGAYGSETVDQLLDVQVLTEQGELKTLTPEEVGYSYRHSGLPAGWLFVGGRWRLKPGDAATIKERMREINTNRRTSQPLNMPSSGSWFKNPTLPDGTKGKAWQVVDSAGGRGLKVGDAQVSEQHSNFFVNLGNATAQDLLELSYKVEALVKEHSGIVLEREARFIGEETCQEKS